MPSINMIAPRRAEKSRLERDMRRLVVVIIAELIFVVAMGGWMCTKMLTTSGRITDLDTQLAKLKPAVRQIEEYQQATIALKPKLDLLNQAKDTTMRWYNTLDRLTQSLPQSTFLTRMNTSVASGTDTKSTLNITGVSESQAKIGETMLRMQSISEFERVDLHYTQKSADTAASAFEFEIGAVLKSAATPEGEQPNGSS
jgi:Tfp pilus assembly protein PilN